MFDLTQWDKKNADSDGKLEERVLELRLHPCGLTRKEAIIVVVAEMEKNPGQTAQFLGIDEHTVHNYHTKIRNKLGISWEEEPDFDMLFRTRRKDKGPDEK